jgi:hypothetical protein
LTIKKPRLGGVRILLFLFMAFFAGGRTGGLIFFFPVFMATFAAFMERVFFGRSISFGLFLMAVPAQISAFLLFIFVPRMVAFGIITINFIIDVMLLVGKCYISV